MSFYTALTGLNGSQADISATSNNIANVGTTGFKRSRAEFGDIFATSPLQNSSSSIGSGTILKGIKQQFTQGNIVSSLNALDLAISGQGFFALKPSLTSAQTVYTRNGSLNVNNDRYVVDSAGQYLLTYPVNNDGSVTAKDLTSAVPLQLPVTSGDPKATSNIELGVNVPADAAVVPEKAEFADGYRFDPNNPESFTNSTSITIFDDLGNPTIATIYFIKTQGASADDPTNKFDTRLVINDTVIDPDLVNAVDNSGRQIFIDRFGNQATTVPDDNYFLEGKGSPLYKLDDLQSQVPSQPAKMTGEATSFDFGEEGDQLVEIVTDPMQFLSTREGGNSEGNVYWGKDFLLVNVDDGDQPVSIDIRPGKYNAEQLSAEVQRAINESYGDDRKVQVVQNVDDTVTIDLIKLNADGVPSGLSEKISVDLLASTFVSDQIPGLDVDGASPDFTLEQFLAHAQARLNDTLNEVAVSNVGGVETATVLGDELNVTNKLFARTSGTKIDEVLQQTQTIEIDHYEMDEVTNEVSTAPHYVNYSFYGRRPTLSVYDAKTEVASNGAGNTIEYDSAQNLLTIELANNNATISAGETIRVAGIFANGTLDDNLNGREFTVLDVVNGSTVRIDTTGLSLPDNSQLETATDIHVLSQQSSDVQAFFEGESDVFEGAPVNFNSEKIVLREIGLSTKHSYTNTDLQNYVNQIVTRETTDGGLNQIVTVETVDGDANAVPTTTLTAGAGGSVTYGANDAFTMDFGNPESNYSFSLGGTTFTVDTAAGPDLATALATTAAAINAVVGLTASSSGNQITVTNGTGGNVVLNTLTATAGDTMADTVFVGGGASAATYGVNDAFTMDFINPDADYGFTLAGQNYTVTTAASGDLATAVATTVAAINTDRVNGLHGLTAVQNGGQITITNGGTGSVTLDTVTATPASTPGIFQISEALLALRDDDGAAIDSLEMLGLVDANGDDATVTQTVWVDEKNPPIKINYDEINQRLQFSVDRTVLGTGTDSNFNSFKISGSSTAEDTNNLGVPAEDDAIESLIRGGEVLYTEPFVADGEEVQLNDKRYGVEVGYNSDTKTFTFRSGSTGEQINANGAIGVDSAQKSSNIQIGRYAISTTDGSVINSTVDLNSRSLGLGDNLLMGVGTTKTDAIFEAGRGLASEPAIAVGAPAKEALTEVFRLSAQNGENIFNVSVNGINGIIEIPTGNYVGSTLAAALEERINQIRDPETAETVGGVRVRYDADANNFNFTTGTTGNTSTIKVKGAARLGLDDVPLGVGSVPEIFNLVQATNAEGVALYVNAQGEVVETPPENLVDGYYPLYIDEGELTFDKTGKLLSPKNQVHYEKQEEGFSISLDIDFGQSTQFAQPFSVLSVEQDGFTSGRLDGLEIDASGTIRANYTNGQNNPLGKIVVANFNNQNGLKQIGNATYVETAVSGTPQVGEAGSEGYGNILSGSLERSNVDITEELVNLITAQRNFQASAKAIETTTTLTQTIINIRM